MTEHLPNPMPEDPEKKAEMEDMLHGLDINAAKSNAKIETDMVKLDLDTDRPAMDIIAGLGGEDEARRVIGDQFTDDLIMLAKQQQGKAPDTVDKFVSGATPDTFMDGSPTKDLGLASEDIDEARKREAKTRAGLSRLDHDGVSAGDRLLALGGYAEAERKIGTAATQELSREAIKEVEELLSSPEKEGEQ